MTSPLSTSSSLKGPAKAVRYFYAAVLLLDALNRSLTRNNLPSQADDISQSLELGAEDLFRSFVSRLGQICDARPGGSTVTAFAVLQSPDKVQFIFASNGRRNNDLKMSKAHVEGVLETLSSMRDVEDTKTMNDMRMGLFYDILCFNRIRVTLYVNALVSSLKDCIEVLDTSENQRGTLCRERSEPGTVS